MKGAWSSLLAGLAAICWSQSAPAAPPDSSGPKRAEQVFHEAEKLFDQKRYAEACAGFAESQRLDPKLGTLLNLAFCHESIGKIATAWSEYNEAAVWASQRQQHDREDFARTRSAELARRLSRVALELPQGQEPAAIELDGEPLPKQRWLTPLFLDPGEHLILVRAAGGKTQTIPVHATEGGAAQTVKVESLEPEPAPSIPPSPPPPPAGNDAQRGPARDAEGGGSRKTVGFVLAGLGVVGVGVGTYFGLRTLADKSDAESHCDVNSRCDPQGVSYYDDAHSHSTISTVAIGLGAASLVAGFLLVVTAPSSSAGSARIDPLVGPHLGGLRLVAAW